MALEQSGRRVGAVRRVKRLGRGSVALRYRGIIQPPPIQTAAATPPASPPTSTLAAVALP